MNPAYLLRSGRLFSALALAVLPACAGGESGAGTAPPSDPPSTDPGILLRALDGDGQPLDGARLVATLEFAGGARAPEQFLGLCDEQGWALFEPNDAWAAPELVSAGFASLTGYERFDRGAAPPRARSGPQIWVELPPLADDAQRNLGELELLTPAERWPDPLAEGIAVSDRDPELISLWAEALPRPLEGAPIRGGLELVLLGEGNFRAFGPPGTARLALRFTARDHLLPEPFEVEPPARDVEVVLLRQ